MNTHLAIIETSVPPALDFIAAGNRQHCEEALANWLVKFPLDYYDTGYVVEIVSAIQTTTPYDEAKHR